MIGKEANVPDLILRDIDPDELRAAIVADVVNELRPMMERRSQTSQRIAGRAPMAEILGWSLAKLDRRTKEKAIPSMLDGDRRLYEIDAVIDAIKAGTAEAEAVAAERQAAKQAAKNANKKGAADA